MDIELQYNWTLKDADFTKDKGTVFSCFACGGGSTMGYKLAGFDVIGCNEIDPKMMDCYKENHNPKYAYLDSIQTFKDRDDLPAELYDLDILDGSPPCSSFSMAGNREKDWGKEKKFREGQAEQVLDTLFFDFIELAKKLQPKVVVAENVKGMLVGDAQQYVDKIMTAFNEAGYFITYTLLDASKMGVPQRRERLFFTAIRKDIYNGDFADLFQSEPVIDLEFNNRAITLGDLGLEYGKEISMPCLRADWQRLTTGQKAKYCQSSIIELNEIHPTITAGYMEKASPMPANRPYWLSKSDLCKIGSYPQDYNFIGCKASYLIGMSVPPIMTAGVATRIKEQWL